jgi:LPS-assembly protein
VLLPLGWGPSEHQRAYRVSGCSCWRTRWGMMAWVVAFPSVQAQQELTPPSVETSTSAPSPQPLLFVKPERPLPIVVQARRISAKPDDETVAEGDAELEKDGWNIQADRLRYGHQDDWAIATGNVRVTQAGDLFTGPELRLKLDTFEGFFDQPTYYFAKARAGGQARRIDFIGRQRSRGFDATYTSCPRDEGQVPAWLLTTRQIDLDFEKNEGVARGAVLRFLGVPILAAPVLSFPITDQRKSGWLPPLLDLDSRSGLRAGASYYWNIAPNYDATFTPIIAARRGAALNSEFRYLRPTYSGQLNFEVLPNDRLTRSDRYVLQARHQGRLTSQFNWGLNIQRVSDDNYWKDFPGALDTLTPRLLLSELRSEGREKDWFYYARAQRWQVLQDLSDPSVNITAPYQRAPQVGVQTEQRLWGMDWSAQTEYNRFTVNDPLQPQGSRVHGLFNLSRSWGDAGWRLTPRLQVNAASYRMDAPLASGPYAGKRQVGRVIPTLSVDSEWIFDRPSTWFGRKLTQTLEPRLLYVHTPYQNQTGLPKFDVAAKDFNFESAFSENAFYGIDRVSDTHGITAGVTSRLLDPNNGAELLRLGLVQRYLFRPQRVTLDDKPLTAQFSDVFLLGSTQVVPRWSFSGSLQYSPDVQRLVRTVVSANYSPGPYRTLNTTYRFTRDQSQQLELGWQWPVYGPARSSASGRALAGQGSCQGSWYSVGRVNYSTRDSRLTDALVGFEYDAGCWVGRIVARRSSTGTSQAVTGLSVQVELTGLSRLALGANPLNLLKDNVPGYRVLADESHLASDKTP